MPTKSVARLLRPCPFCGEALDVDEKMKMYTHPNNGCFLSFIDTEYEAVFFYTSDAVAIEAWEIRAKENDHE